LRQKQSPVLSPGLPKLNPGLKLVNTFGVTLQESEFSHNLFQPCGVSTSTLEFTSWASTIGIRQSAITNDFELVQKNS